MPRSAHVARSHSSLAALLAGLRPPDPLTRSLAGTPHAPLRSRGSLARLARCRTAGLAPQTPIHVRSRGPLMPRSAHVARSRGSLAPHSGLGPPDPHTRSLAGTPHAPLRSRGSLAQLARAYCGLRPPDPHTRSLAGAPHAPLRSRGSLARLARCVLAGLRPPDLLTRRPLLRARVARSLAAGFVHGIPSHLSLPPFDTLRSIYLMTNDHDGRRENGTNGGCHIGPPTVRKESSWHPAHPER